jgi:flagellar motor switch protein FliN
MAEEQPPVSEPQAETPQENVVPDPSAALEAVQNAAEQVVAAAAPLAESPSTSANPASSEQSAIDELLKQANFEDVSAADIPGGAVPGTTPLELPNLQQVMQDAQASSIELLKDVELNVKIELGRSRMLVEDVLKLTEGSVVELDKLAGDPVDVFVNDRLVARGEVLVLNDNFCVRVNEIVAGVKEEAL